VNDPDYFIVVHIIYPWNALTTYQGSRRTRLRLRLSISTAHRVDSRS